MAIAIPDGTARDEDSGGLGWLPMLRDLLAFIRAGGPSPAPEDEDPEQGGEDAPLESFHPMLAVHYASPQI